MSPSKVTTIDFSTFQNVIDGKLVGSEEQYHGTNPSTGEELWPVPVASEEDVNTAVTAARKAFKSWRNVPVEDRRQALYAWSSKLVEYKDELTEILCKEVGRPKQFAAMEVDIVKGTVDTLAALDLPVERIEDDTKILTTRYVPLGVVAAIAPFNFPLIVCHDPVDC
jgi:acyl-CoA reductase-like NAD-dependent aldehyde dehydrogenase